MRERHRRGMSAWRAGAAALALCAAAVVTCGCAGREEDAGAARFEVSQAKSAMGVRVSMYVSRKELSIADRLEVLLETRRDSGAVAWPPELASADAGKPFPPNPAEPEVSEWTVIEASREVVGPGHETLLLVLEPYLAGTKRLPSFTFSTNGLAGDAVVTDPVVIEVRGSKATEALADPGAALAELNSLGDALPPEAVEGEWYTRPAFIGIAGGGAVLLVGGLAGLWALRRGAGGSASPESVFQREVARVRARLAASPRPAPAEIVEHVIALLRNWLVSTGRVQPGATGRELAGWVRASSAASGPELARRLEEVERSRFAPGGAADEAEVESLLAATIQFVGELRSAAASARGGIAA